MLFWGTLLRLQISGPNEPGGGHRFDDQKILLDPYARSSVFSAPIQSRNRTNGRQQCGKGAARRVGSGGRFAPGREIVLLNTPRDLVIYELHVRAFTARDNSGVISTKRGTFAGLIEKIPYLKNLGITAVELMPVAQQDRRNAWQLGLHASGILCAAPRLFQR